MHHWEYEYFDTDYDEKQIILKQIAKDDYDKMIKELEIYEQYKRNAEPGEYYPNCAA